MPSILLDYDRLFIESSIQVYCLTIVHIMLWLFELFVWIVLGSASILQSSSYGTLLLSFVESWSSHNLRTMLLISVRIVAPPRIRCWTCTSSESDGSAAPLANVWKFRGTHSNEVNTSLALRERPRSDAERRQCDGDATAMRRRCNDGDPTAIRQPCNRAATA